MFKAKVLGSVFLLVVGAVFFASAAVSSETAQVSECEMHTEKISKTETQTDLKEARRDRRIEMWLDQGFAPGMRAKPRL